MRKIRARASHGGPGYFPIVVAERLGFFARHGIEMDYSEPSYGPWIAKDLLDGKSDIALGGIWRPQMYRGRLGTLYAFAQVCARCYVALVSRKPFESFRWADMKESTVVVPSSAPSPSLYLTGLLERRGVAVSSISFVREFIPVEAVDLFRAGLGDFLLTSQETAAQLVHEGAAHIAMDLADAGPVPWSVYYAPEEFLATEGGEIAREFVTAFQEALDWVHASSAAERERITRQHYGSLGDRAVEAVERCLAKDVWPASAVIPEGPLRDWQQMVVEARLAPKIIPYEDLVKTPFRA